MSNGLWRSISRRNLYKDGGEFFLRKNLNLRFALILSSLLPLGLPKGPFHAGVPLKFWKHSYLLPWSAHLNFLDLITLIVLGGRYKLWSSSLWSLLHSPFASLLDPNIRLRVLFSNTLSLRFTLNVRDHAPLPFSTTRQYYCFIYYNIQILREKSRRLKCLDWIITWISCFKSTFYFLLNRILIFH